MAFVTGLMGPYMSPIPINASMGMLISLAIAFIVTPWLALRLLQPAGRQRRTREARELGACLRAPARALRSTLGAQPQPRLLGCGVAALIAASVALPAARSWWC